MDIVEGWKAIADKLRSHINTVQRWARRDKDPLPVRVSHKGVYAHITALEAWANRQDLPLQSYDELKALRAENAALRNAKVSGGASSRPRLVKRSASRMREGAS